MRHATWDIVMAGGYVVTGFGTTYFGGNRDPGTFDLDTKKNDVWEAQLGHMRRVFLPLSWWKLQSHDELLSCEMPRGKEGKEFNQVVPPATTYWCLADVGRTYVVSYRGLTAPLHLNLEGSQGSLAVMQFNPRNGERKLLAKASGSEPYEIRPPDEQDWVILLSAVK